MNNLNFVKVIIMVAEVNNPLGPSQIAAALAAAKANSTRTAQNPAGLPQGGVQNVRADTVSISARGLRASETGKTIAGLSREGTPPKTVRDVTEDNRVVVKVVDPETNEVIRQVPSEEMVRLQRAVRQLVEENQARTQQSDA